MEVALYCFAQEEAKLESGHGEGCGQGEPERTEEVFALCVAEGEGFVGSHGCSTVDSDGLVNMAEGKGLIVLATALRRAWTQTWLQGSAVSQVSALLALLETGSRLLWTVPLFCFMSPPLLSDCPSSANHGKQQWARGFRDGQCGVERGSRLSQYDEFCRI
jgi:hypothetical protein